MSVFWCNDCGLFRDEDELVSKFSYHKDFCPICGGKLRNVVKWVDIDGYTVDCCRVWQHSW